MYAWVKNLVPQVPDLWQLLDKCIKCRSLFGTCIGKQSTKKEFGVLQSTGYQEARAAGVGISHVFYCVLLS